VQLLDLTLDTPDAEQEKNRVDGPRQATQAQSKREKKSKVDERAEPFYPADVDFIFLAWPNSCGNGPSVYGAQHAKHEKAAAQNAEHIALQLRAILMIRS